MTDRPMGPAMLALSHQHRKFVWHFNEHGKPRQAAIAAGFAEASASQRAQKLLKRPDIKAALAEAANYDQQEHNYDQHTALAEVHETLRQAVAANQFTAASKLLELKCRLMGLLVDRIDIAGLNQVVIQLPSRESLIEAPLDRFINSPGEVIEGEPLVRLTDGKATEHAPD